ncbi:MAG: hypothetical protein HZC41_12640 [Chloroflexi bacterium]|nr:hypothetical protein [Chloroflexota bacterium]
MNNPAADEKETRRLLRLVQDHLFGAQESLGAVRETLGMVEVLHHPANPHAALNYVTPRRNTAWISGKMVEQGLERLRELGRAGRIQYIEGLYPPQFAQTLRALKLEVERKTPLLVYKPDGINGRVPPPPGTAIMPDGVAMERVSDRRGIELWWYAWRNAYFDVLTLGVEPLLVGRDLAALKLGQQADILVYRYGFPVGVARLSLQGETAHLLAVALLREVRTPALLRALAQTALTTALDRQSTLIFAPGDGDTAVLRELGFEELGAMVCYAAASAREENHEPDVEQPLLSL